MYVSLVGKPTCYTLLKVSLISKGEAKYHSFSSKARLICLTTQYILFKSEMVLTEVKLLQRNDTGVVLNILVCTLDRMIFPKVFETLPKLIC